MNVHGSWMNYALMLDLPMDTPLQQLFHELVKKADRFPISSKTVDRAPLKETIFTKNINILDVLPVFRVNDYDGGPYLSKAVVVSRDPENFKNQNLGIYRLQVKDKDRLGIQTSPQHDIAVNPQEGRRTESTPPRGDCLWETIRSSAWQRECLCSMMRMSTRWRERCEGSRPRSFGRKPLT